MSFINFNPENSFPEISFNNGDTKIFDTKENTFSQDKTFEKILEKTYDSSEKPGSREIENSKQGKIDKQGKINKNEPDRGDQEKEFIGQSQKSELEKFSKLLALLEKLIRGKKLSGIEQTYLTQNQNSNLFFLKELLGELTIKGEKNIFDLFLAKNNFLAKKSSGEAVKLPPEILQQIKTITELLKKWKENTGVTKSSGQSLEKLIDIDKLHSKVDGEKPFQVKDIYIKTQDRYNVLKGNSTNKKSDQVSSTTEDPKVKVDRPLPVFKESNPTHQKNSVNNGVSMGQVQKNLVIRPSNGSGKGLQDFSSQGAPQPSYSSSPLEKVSNMFSQNGLPQSLNFKSLIQHLAGKIHNGFVSGKQVMLVRLQPESLGQIQVFLQKESDHSLRLKLRVDSLEMKELLDKSSYEIRVGLNKDNLDLLSFDVDVNGNTASKEEQEEEKKFSDFFSFSTNKNFNEEKNETVDLIVKNYILNIRI